MNSRTECLAFGESPATAENSLLAGLAALVSRTFAEKITAVTPRVCSSLRDQFNKSGNANESDILPYVVSILVDRREKLATQVERSLRQRFAAKLECAEDAISHTGQFSLAALALMEELGMREEFELEQCVSRLREQCQPELFRLTTFLRKLLAYDSLPEARNPIFPRVFLRALNDALMHIGCDTRIRRVVFRAYSSLLPKIITELYARANEMLVVAEQRGKIDGDGRRGGPRMPESARTNAASLR